VESAPQAYRLKASNAAPPFSTSAGTFPYLSETWLWRVAALCFAIPMLVLLLTHSHRRRKAVGTGPTPGGFVVFMLVGSAAIAAMLIYVIGGFEYQPAAYITALTVNFFTTAFGFVIAIDVILQQPVEG
jgi:hypothetical protein